MHIDHHPLSTEFPEFKDAIHNLKLGDPHFSKLYEEYDASDKAINRAENGLDHLGDIELENLKKVRITLKDQIFSLLKKQAER